MTNYNISTLLKQLLLKIIYYKYINLLILLFCAVQVSATNLYAKEKIYFLGDSLTEGYGISREKAYPYLIQQKLIQDKLLNWEVINSSQSGSTSASAKSRVDWILKAKPKIIVLSLGANDALRGLKVENTYKNLAEAIEKILAAKSKVLLVGMKAPPNYGVQYTKDFEKIYADLSKKYKIPLVPFLLDGVAGDKNLNLEDAIHPNEKGHEIMAQTVYKYLKREL